MTLDILQRINEHARQRPDAQAAEQLDPNGAPCDSMSYGQLHSRISALAAHFAGTYSPGSTILIQLPNCIPFMVAYLAALAAGLTIFPLHPSLATEEVEHAAATARAVATIADQAPPAGLSRITTADVDRLAQQTPPGRPLPASGGRMLLQSSGTTGTPGIVIRSAAAIDAVARNVADAVGLSPRDHVLAAIMICHSYGLEHGLLGPLWAGARVTLCQGFDLAVLSRQWDRGRNVVLPGVPVMFEMLAQSSLADVGRGGLRCAYSAGAPLPSSVANDFQRRFGLAIGQVYGATEIGSVTYNDPASPAFAPDSVGPPMPGVEIRILDVDEPDPGHPLPAAVEGQVTVRALSMLAGYADGRPHECLDGFFLTGDLGSLNDSGSLTLTGRLKTLIDVGGIKVNPYEVEAIVTQHPAVRECVVVPARVSQTLVRLTAYVTPASPGATIDTAALRAYVRGRLAPYKVPRSFTVIDELPRSTTGKVQRQTLMERTP